MNRAYKNKLTLTRILGAKEPKVFYVTEQYSTFNNDLDERVQVWRGFEIENGDIDDHSHFEVIAYEGGGYSTVSSRAWYNELEEFVETELLEAS